MQGKFLKALLFTLLVIVCSIATLAAPPTPPTGFTNPQGVPLDGGLIWLAAIGAFFGAKRMLKGQDK